MKRLFLLLIFFFSYTLAQYNSERSNEQSFENSPLYFNTTYINTYGLSNFKEILPGLVDDPFMDIYLNPANLPDLKGNDILFYVDFSGDREESSIISNYPYPNYYLRDMYYAPTLDPRWLSSSRSEPAPIATLGIITHPLGKEISELVVGATYQLIYKEDRFYNVPYWIYNYSPYLDSFNGARSAENTQDIPVIDRYNGEDHMTTDGHLLTTFLSYKLSGSLNLGLGVSGVWHNRSGSYLEEQQDEYGNFDRNEWSNRQYQERDQDYSHIDISGGIKYNPNDKTGIGLKLGYLSGTADQIYNSDNYYLSEYDYSNNDDNWSLSYSESNTEEVWNREGKTKYLGFYFEKEFKENTRMTIFYRHSNASVDLTSSSVITDTSYYESNWVSSYDYDVSHYLNNSSTSDIRNSSGSQSLTKHEAGCYLKWDIESNIKFSAGLYYSNYRTETEVNEPVSASRYSYYYHTHTTYQDYYNELDLRELKTLKWNYNSEHWTFQIPAILDIKATENLGIILGVNRKLETWKLEDETTAYFDYRDQHENGVKTREENFGERYRQPVSNISENTTDIFAGLTVTISDQLKIRLLVDPDWEESPKFKQWHLSFYGWL